MSQYICGYVPYSKKIRSCTLSGGTNVTEDSIDLILKTGLDIAANVLQDDTGIIPCLLLAQVTQIILTSPNPLIKPLFKSIISEDKDSADTRKNMCARVTDAVWVAWNIAGNVLKSALATSEQSFDDRVALAKAVAYMGFSAHTPITTVDAFLTQDANNPVKAGVYEGLDTALRRAVKKAQEHLGQDSPFVALYAGDIISLAFAPHASLEVRAQFLNL